MGYADYQTALLTAHPKGFALPMQELVAKILGEASKRRMQQILLVGAAPGVGTSMVSFCILPIIWLLFPDACTISDERKKIIKK